MPAFVPPLCLVAAVTYASFGLEHLLSPELDVIDGYASELSAVDQPYHLVYSTGDLITGILAIVVAGTGLLVLRRRRWAVVGWVFLLLFGLSAIGDAVFPLDCAPSLETRCALLERAEQVSFSHEFHAVTSSAVILFGVLALFTLSMAARRYGWWPALARWGWLLAVLEAIAAVVTLGLMLVGHWLGFVQRIQISILCLALLVIGWALHADRRLASASRTPPASGTPSASETASGIVSASGPVPGSTSGWVSVSEPASGGITGGSPGAEA